MRRLGLAGTVMLMLAGQASAEIVIGGMAPMTGPSAAAGQQLKAGVEYAATVINAQGGILGQKVKVVLGDDQGDPKAGVSVANRFVSDGVKSVVGPMFSAIAVPTSEVTAENGILQITPSATHPSFTERGLWNAFRTCGRDDQQGTVAGEHLATNFAQKRIALVHDRSAYGKGLADVVKSTINARGVKEAIFETINPGEKDYSAIVSKLKGANVDVVFYGGLYTEAGLLVRQMRDQGFGATLIGGDGLATSEFWAVAGPGAEGTLMANSPDPRKNPAAAPIVADMKAKGIETESYTLYSFAAMQVIKQAAEKAGSVDPKKVAEAMKSGQTFDTAVGPLQFDQRGDLKKAGFVIFRWSKGEFTQVGS